MAQSRWGNPFAAGIKPAGQVQQGARRLSNEHELSAASFALAAIPARLGLEHRDWEAAVKLEPRSSPFPSTEAITYITRALGAAHLGEAAMGQSAVDRIKQIQEGLIGANEVYRAEQVEIQHRAAIAWFLLAQGHKSEALIMMRSAAEREDAIEKNAVTPGPIAPARELLGDMLLELKQPSEAIKVYETGLLKESFSAGLRGSADRGLGR